MKTTGTELTAVAWARNDPLGTHLRVLLINDHPLFGFGLRTLQIEVEQIVCNCVVSTKVALEMGGPLDLILMGLDQPDVARLANLDALQLAFPGTPVSLVSRRAGRDLMDQALKASVACRVPRSAAPDLLVEAMRLVLAGHQLLAASSTGAPPLSSASGPDGDAHGPLGQLTDRQKEILVRVIQGNPNKAIARSMGIAEATVKSHVSSIFRTLKVHNRTAAVLEARKLGLLAALSEPSGAQPSPRRTSPTPPASD